MSHRRRLLNLLTANDVVGMYSLRRIDLHSRLNNLFYPTAADAAAAARHPKKMERIQVRTRATLFSGERLDWAALTERRMVYVDHHSRKAFVYDADEGCVALPSNILAGSSNSNRVVPICFSVAGGGAEQEEKVYVMERSPKPAGGGEDNGLQFQAMVHGKEPLLSGDDRNRWRCDALPPPPYVRDAGYRSTGIDSYALVGVGGAADVFCVSTEGIGTYCFDTASREWSKAGDWALPFSGKVEHVPELGALVGFWARECGHRLCASTSDLSSAGESRRPMLRAWLDLEPPYGEWVKARAPQLISLGSGKFCLAEFFKTTTATKKCHHELDEWFAVLTGVEVVRHGHGHGGGSDELQGNGKFERGLRVIKHKSKRYVSTNHKSFRQAMVEFVL